MMSAAGQPCLLNEQAIGWALHSLEPDEEMAVLLHVPLCPSCQDAVRGAEDVLASLGAAVPQIDPPRSLRGNIMAAAAQTPQRQVARTHEEVRRTPSVPAQGGAAPRDNGQRAPSGPPSRPSAPSRTSRPGGRRIRLVASALALVGVLAVGGLGVYTVQLQQQRDAVTVQAQRITELVTEIDRPGVRHALLADAETNSTVGVVLVADGQREVYSLGLDANAVENSTYVLWGLRDAAAPPQALGTFDVALTDEGVRAVGSGGQTDNFVAYAVSLEPGRAAPAAPSSVVAAGQVEI